MSALRGEFLRFAAVGALATGIQYAIFGALTALRLLDAPFASGLGYLFGAAASYLANRGFTFASTRAHRSAVLRFGLMVAAAWLLTMASMGFMVNWMSWDKWPAQVATTAVCLLFNYMVSRRWVFRSGSP